MGEAASAVAAPTCKGDISIGTGCRRCSRCISRAFDLADRWINRGELPDQPGIILGDGLHALAERLTPNPALSVAGTLAMILDGIDRIDDEQLARTLGYVVAKNPGDFDGSGQGRDVEPLTDEQWAHADILSKAQLMLTAKAVKLALRIMTA
jgi:hypothetical protein